MNEDEDEDNIIIEATETEEEPEAIVKILDKSEKNIDEIKMLNQAKYDKIMNKENQNQNQNQDPKTTPIFKTTNIEDSTDPSGINIDIKVNVNSDNPDFSTQPNGNANGNAKFVPDFGVGCAGLSYVVGLPPQYDIDITYVFEFSTTKELDINLGIPPLY